MRALSIDEARAQLAELIRRVVEHGERICLTQDGKPVAALISMPELKLFEALQDADDLAYIKETEADDEGPNIPLQQAIEDIRRDRQRRT